MDAWYKNDASDLSLKFSRESQHCEIFSPVKQLSPVEQPEVGGGQMTISQKQKWLLALKRTVHKIKQSSGDSVFNHFFGSQSFLNDFWSIQKPAFVLQD